MSFQGAADIPSKLLREDGYSHKERDRQLLSITPQSPFSMSLGDLADYGFKGEFLSRVANSTPVVVPYEWHLPDGTIAPVSLTSNALTQSPGVTEAVSLP